MTTDNSRVTVAVLKAEMAHLSAKIDRYHDEVCDDLKDHEQRLRDLEGRQSWSVWRDVGAFAAAAAAGVTAYFTGNR